MKVIIAGTRTFNNYNLLKSILEEYYKQEGEIQIEEIVCGEAKGADSLGKKWALENNIPVKSFPADWDKYGKSAGPRRNMEMADYADYLLAFWDGKSRGTKHMIEYMQQLGKHGRVIIYI